MWHLPQVSGVRACAAENSWREWHAAQEPSLPSGLIRPMPVFGHTAGSGLPLAAILTSAPWHCQQPLAAAAETPLGKEAVLKPRLPSTTSASTLSSEPRIRAALAWWEALNSATSPSWQRPQSLG